MANFSTRVSCCCCFFFIYFFFYFLVTVITTFVTLRLLALTNFARKIRSSSHVLQCTLWGCSCRKSSCTTTIEVPLVLSLCRLFRPFSPNLASGILNSKHCCCCCCCCWSQDRAFYSVLLLLLLLLSSVLFVDMRVCDAYWYDGVYSYPTPLVRAHYRSVRMDNVGTYYVHDSREFIT